MYKHLRQTFGELGLSQGFNVRFDLKAIPKQDSNMIFQPDPMFDGVPGLGRVKILIGGTMAAPIETLARIETIVAVMNDPDLHRGPYRWRVIDHTPLKRPKIDILARSWWVITIEGVEKNAAPIVEAMRPYSSNPWK